MSDIINDLKYTDSHEWVKIDNNIATVGITDHAQSAMGELVFVELPEVDDSVSSGDEIATVESTKTASDVYAPLAGKIIAINQALDDNPNLVNDSPYSDGWLFKIDLDQNQDQKIEQLLTADAYRALDN